MAWRFLLTAFLLAVVVASAVACGGDDDDDDTSADDDADDDSTDDDDDTSDDDTTDDDIGGDIMISAYTQIVPSELMPEEVAPQDANNNLDVVEHEGRYYLAFRTGPFHFASPDVVMYVVSSDDQVNWEYETEFTMERDLREPRLLSFDGKLFLYFALLGESAFGFEPGGMMVSERKGAGDWTEPVPVEEEIGYIPWRTKAIDGVPYMIAYEGGGSIYDFVGDPEPIKVHWLTTEDGYDWSAVDPEHEVVLEGGNSETDWVFLDDGSLVAVTRNEAGDEFGWGSKICRADADNLGDWQCAGDPKKYDSPLVFRTQDNRVFLIGRRNVTEDGLYDLGRDDLSETLQGIYYELAYWVKPKRCSLWSVDPETLSVDFVLDLPSSGDTCFAGIIDYGDDTFEVYNYTSPPTQGDLWWIQGQLAPTFIYRLTLTIP
ncbi:hypothetical protein KDL45_10270 [bacterium]|nr:hypothetical protein [bacterium]